MTRRPDRPRAFYGGILLLGIASGMRAQIGVATVVRSVPPAALPRSLRRAFVRRALTAGALGELVADKLPSIPARTEPPGLAARALTGLASGVLVARTMGLAAKRAAVVGSLTAVPAAYGGLALRRYLTSRLPAVAAAGVEDLLAGSLAYAGIRLARS